MIRIPQCGSETFTRGNGERQAPSLAVCEHMEYIVVAGKYILRISPASFQIHSTQDYYRCHEKWAFAPSPLGGGQFSSKGVGARGSLCPSLDEEPGTETLQVPRSGGFCFPQWVCAGWDINENDKYLLSPIPNLVPFPYIVSF